MPSLTPTIPVLPQASHRNQQLFSDYYLNKILPTRPEWGALNAESASLLAQLKTLYAGYSPSSNEAQTEREWVQPVLDHLGHDFEVQAALKTADGTKRPDYVFYRTSAARTANKNKTLDDHLPQQGAYAVGDAKAWERPLDMAVKTNGADALSNKNPAYQIAFYIQHSGVDWGILTNGRQWRLYHRETAHKLDRYYEIDLPALLAADDTSQFLYFYAFFRRAAFDPGPLSVDDLLHASVDYARGVGDTLKGQVYEALRHLAQGFLDYTPNALTLDAATLKVIYDNALIVLYRLLFVLYAEARQMLPLDHRDYRESYSLYALKQQIADALDANKLLLATSTKLWPSLTSLFAIIDQGSPPLHVTTYNGGLFDPTLRNGFLEKNAVGDLHLQRAVDLLTRVHDPLGMGRVFVDYRDLSVRHLGTIYEGLLEYHLEALDTPEDGWTVALLNDKGERKATGSYYTPDYIVKYIVEQTVGPMLADAVLGAPDDAAKVSAVLSVNVLDPAMGSGHFLVEVTEYIARYLVELALTPEGEGQGETEIAYWKRRVVQSCIYGVDLNPLAVDLAKLSLWLTTLANDRPLSFLDHHLRCGNALVGARLSDLQISRPKKSRTKASAPEAAQAALFDDDALRQSMTSAVTRMVRIEASPAENVTDVKRQEQDYRDLRAGLSREYGPLVALVTSTHFGIEIDPSLWKPLSAFATGKEAAAVETFQQWVTDAGELSGRHRFFHWELEFPEVFFDTEGRSLGDAAGFDAVVGNPPYVRQELLSPFKPYLKANYASFHSVADLYLYFFEQGLNVLATGGRLSYITSGTFARANFAGPFRTLLPSLAQIESLIDFGENQPFTGAEMVRPTIIVLKKGARTETFRSLFLSAKIPASLDLAVAEEGIESESTLLQQPEWTFQAATDTRLANKIFSTGKLLIDVVSGGINRGVTTGLNEAFFVDTATRNQLLKADATSTEIIKPFIQGEDLRPWYQEAEGRWLIFTRRGIDIDRYPAVKQYLEQFRAKLEPGSGRKAGSYKWFEIQDSVDYYDAFERPKIFWPDISKLPRFSWDDSGMYIGNTGFIISDTTPLLLGILQSRVTWYALSQICTQLRLRVGLWQYRLFPQFVGRLPIPDLENAQGIEVGRLALEITEQARARYDLHTKTRNRILRDLGTPGIGLNQKLTAWWTLDFSAFRKELQTVFRRDISVKDRDDWEAWLADKRAEHAAMTETIIGLETVLNQVVYGLYDLNEEEIKTVESSTKYKYGEV